MNPPTPSEGKSELRDTQLEEWEEVLPSPPMLSDSPSSRTNLSSGGVLSLDSPLTWRNIRKLTFIRPPAVSLLPAVYECVCVLFNFFLIFSVILEELIVYCTVCRYSYVSMRAPGSLARV